MGAYHRTSDGQEHKTSWRAGLRTRHDFSRTFHSVKRARQPLSRLAWVALRWQGTSCSQIVHVLNYILLSPLNHVMNLPELVSSAIESAIASQRPLSWKVQESNKGTLILLVWKSQPTSSCVRVRSRPTGTVRSKWNPPAGQPHNNNNFKISKKSPSRIRRNAKRLQIFLEKKERKELNSKDSLDDCQQPGSPVVCVANS